MATSLEETKTQEPPSDGDRMAVDSSDSEIEAGDNAFEEQVKRRFQKAKADYLANQRAKAATEVQNNKDRLDAHLASWLETLTARPSQSIPRTSGPVLGGRPGADSGDEGAGGSRQQTGRSGSVPPSRTHSDAGGAVAAAGPVPGAGPAAAGGPGGGAPPGALPLVARIGLRTNGAGGPSGKLSAHQMPAYKMPPRYWTWAYLRRNELARDHGKRMFYTDDTGETVPASDEEDERLPWEDGRGAATDAAILEVVQEMGRSPPVMAALAACLGCSEQQVARRVQELVGEGLGQDAREASGLQVASEAFDGLFCRRCYTYACRLHGGGHVKPSMQPAPALAPSNAAPCGPNCWKLQPQPQPQQKPPQPPQPQQQQQQQQQGPAGAGAAAGAAGAVSDGANGGAPAAQAAAAAAGGSSNGATDEAAGPSSMMAMMDVSPGGATPVGAAVPPASYSDVRRRMSSMELGLFGKAVAVFGSHCCAVARMVGAKFSCAEIKGALDSALAAQAAQPGAQAGAGRRVKKGPKKYAPASGRPSGHSLVVLKRMKHSGKAWPEYTPCACRGPCTPGCSCTASKNFCEKFCACSAQCTNRFRGCKCSSQCRTRQCPCFAAGRECDPDICRGCSATCDGSAPPGSACNNMRLRLRQHRRILMGTSTIQGWGCFLQSFTPRDSFLGEYTGDLITQDEADRRGRIYDRINNSYLFNLNEQWVLDARYRGNKLRFANHSSEPNCYARVLMVDGDHRVAIFAKRDIQAGEELYYNYMYEDTAAPEWAHDG